MTPDNTDDRTRETSCTGAMADAGEDHQSDRDHLGDQSTKAGRWQPNRPLSDEERRALAAMGATLREAREEAKFSRPELARASGVSRSHIAVLEAGERRTRHSTLRRLVEAMYDGAVADELLADLVDVAGPAIVPERRPVSPSRTRRRMSSVRREREQVMAALRFAERAGMDAGVREARAQVDRLDRILGRIREEGNSRASDDGGES